MRKSQKENGKSSGATLSNFSLNLLKISKGERQENSPLAMIFPFICLLNLKRRTASFYDNEDEAREKTTNLKRRTARICLLHIRHVQFLSQKSQKENGKLILNATSKTLKTIAKISKGERQVVAPMGGDEL